MLNAVALAPTLDASTSDAAMSDQAVSDHAVTVSLPPLQADTLSLPTLKRTADANPHAAPAPLPLPERYLYQAKLGEGGMGEVHRVFDRYLNRTMAMKVVRRQLVGVHECESRFLAEAQSTAQLQHPGIVPVFDIGRLEDRRYYFTMKEVQGQTFDEVIREVHQASPAGQWEMSPSGWTFWRLVEAFHKVCEAMAYSHRRGVVHRDLKPSNIMVGRFGEVLVMDWGLAKVIGSEEEASVAQELLPVQTVRTTEAGLETCAGRIAGTIAYMPPEQARGQIALLGPASDVYSLGAVLFEVLSGRAPHVRDVGLNLMERLHRRNPPNPPHPLKETPDNDAENNPLPPNATPLRTHEGARPPLPAELVSICARALSVEPAARYEDASALSSAIQEWIEQARRRERGLYALAQVAELPARVMASRAQAARKRAEADALLSRLPVWEEVEKRKPGWALQDEALRLEQEADLDTIRYTQGVRGALTQDPSLPEAHEALAAFYHDCHREAESRRDERGTAQWDLLLREHDKRHQYATYLNGHGAVSLVTNPEAAEVLLFRYETFERRLEPRFVTSLGHTPLQEVPLEKGSYLLHISRPGHELVRYPVHIARGDHWDGIPPEGGSAHPIHLPERGKLDPHDCYIPAGWFWCGGDADALNSLPRERVWVDAFVVQKFPVTNRQYLAFLNELLGQGHESEALRWAPRERPGAFGQAGALLYARDERHHFVLQADAEGDIWELDWPVFQIDWFCAQAYAEWEAGKSGLPWRMPCELEWEKAGRGVDGRFFPWGDSVAPSWVCARESHRGRPLPSGVDSHPIDESVYGVRGLGGNVRDWCLDLYRQEGPARQQGRVIVRHEAGNDLTNRVSRGGSWSARPRGLRLAYRGGGGPSWRAVSQGFRLARSYL